MKLARLLDVTPVELKKKGEILSLVVGRLDGWPTVTRVKIHLSEYFSE